DLNLREKLVLIPLIIAIFWIGIYPKPFFSRMEPSVKSLIENAQVKYEENRSLEKSLAQDSRQVEPTKQME
ncbi:MAG: Fe-S-binding domain-containing protein, partial [Candidatus Zixiibacteriota bacterium]